MTNPLCVTQEGDFNTLLRRAVDLEESVGGRDGADSDEDDEQIGPGNAVRVVDDGGFDSLRSCIGGEALIQAPVDCGSLLDGVSQSTPSPLEATAGNSLDGTAEKSNKIAKSKKASKDRRAKKRARERAKHHGIRGDVRSRLVMAAGAIATELSTESLPVAQGGSQALNYKAKPKLPKLTLKALKKGGYRYVEWNGGFLSPDPCRQSRSSPYLPTGSHQVKTISLCLTAQVV